VRRVKIAHMQAAVPVGNGELGLCCLCCTYFTQHTGGVLEGTPLWVYMHTRFLVEVKKYTKVFRFAA